MFVVCFQHVCLFICFFQSSDEDVEEFQVELNKPEGRGLGITIAGLADAETGGMYLHG